MKDIIKKIFSALFVFAGICLLFYPWISNYVNSHQAENEVKSYTETVEKNADKEEQERLYKEAVEYNKTLPDNQIHLTEPFEASLVNTEPYVYENLLSVNGMDTMGSIKIPDINVNLPIMHGTSDAVLQKAVGHLKGSSLPVGGKDTHCVLTGHTGLSNMKLFTDLTELKKGDVFILTTLGHKLAYKVIDIYVVTPNDVDKLKIIEGLDLCTLVTCTPYGINSHRLLVRAERTKYVPEDEKVPFTNPIRSQWMRSYLIAVLIGLGIALLLIILHRIFIITKRKKEKNKNNSVSVDHKNNKKGEKV